VESSDNLVLLVDVLRLLENPGIDQHDRRSVAAGRLDHCRGPADADLQGRESHALGEHVYLPDSLHRGVQAFDTPLCRVTVGGQVEGRAASLRSGAPYWTTPISRIR
jgi:hypothetical protein